MSKSSNSFSPWVALLFAGLNGLVMTGRAAAGLDPGSEPSSGTPRVELRFDGILGRSGTGPGEFHRPLALASTATGGLLVADTGNNRVQCLDAGGRFLWEAGGVGTDEGSLRRPTSAAPATGLEFLVLDAGNRRIHQFHARGQYLGVALDLTIGELVERVGPVDPRSLAMDRLGNVLVTDVEGDQLLSFSPAWKLVYVAGGFGGGGQHFEEPEGVASAGDRVFVADSGNGRIQVLDLFGRFLTQWPLPGGGRPLGLALDRRGNLFVADATGDRVVVFGPAGSVITTFGARGKGIGSFRGPAGVCVLGDRLIVADAENDRLVSLIMDYGTSEDR
jgi:DNA-binding beta-propeller fold protein YncE